MRKKQRKIKLFNITKIRWSVEIEVEFPSKKNSEKLIDRHRVLQGWEITWDGSLSNGAEYRPKKSNKLYFNEEAMTQLKEILALIKVHRGTISNRCGLHIHVDCLKLKDYQILEIIKEFIHKQRYIVKKFNIDESRLQDTCKLLPRENLNKLSIKQIHKFRTHETQWSFNDYNYFDEKYYSLNASHLRKGDYGTLEFRLFDATTSYRKLKSQIQWTLNFIKDSIERE